MCVCKNSLFTVQQFFSQPFATKKLIKQKICEFHKKSACAHLTLFKNYPSNFKCHTAAESICCHQAKIWFGCSRYTQLITPNQHKSSLCTEQWRSRPSSSSPSRRLSGTSPLPNRRNQDAGHWPLAPPSPNAFGDTSNSKTTHTTLDQCTRDDPREIE